MGIVIICVVYAGCLSGSLQTPVHWIRTQNDNFYTSGLK